MNINNELESIVDTNLNLDYYIYTLMYVKLGFESHLIGSHYLGEYIEDSIKNGYNLYSLSPTKEIYPKIAEIHKSSIKKVEHAIRTSIERAWINMDELTKKIIFPTYNVTRPTNLEVICAIYDYVKAYYPLDFEKYLIEINGKIMESSKEWIYYQINFLLQQLLENKYQIKTKFGIIKLHLLIDAIMYKMNFEGYNEDEKLIEYLNRKYNLYDGTLISKDECLEISETVTILFKMCKQIYIFDNDYPVPKNKKYVKTYLDILSKKTNKILK